MSVALVKMPGGHSYIEARVEGATYRVSHRAYSVEEDALLCELERRIRQEWFGEYRDEHLREPGDILRALDALRRSA